ncbi:hypothetical protein [Nocardiopsis sp. NPDC006832]|uniref:hypothetical protein n=1 Tax=Nocardiopsis sp. NPDC006832 TaxID=3157188 RepID=UPI0033D05FD6
MASSEQRDTGRTPEAEAEAEDPSVGVPEADAAEQRTSAGPDEEGRPFEDTSQDAFIEANEADVIDQSIDAGEDEDERR